MRAHPEISFKYALEFMASERFVCKYALRFCLRVCSYVLFGYLLLILFTSVLLNFVCEYALKLWKFSLNFVCKYALKFVLEYSSR